MAEEHGDNPAPSWRGIGLRLGVHRLVVPLEAVSEVRPMPALARVPGGAPWLLGVGNANGRLLTVNDLAAYAGVDIEEAVERQVAVLERAGHLRGFTVDEVCGVAQYADARGDAVTPPPGLARLLAGAARRGDEVAGVLDATALLDQVASCPGAA